MIPKILHLIWVGDKEIPELYKACINSWEKYAPKTEYKLMYWNNDTLPTDDPFISSMLKKKKYAFLSDYLRCKVLFEYGGIYLDADMELISSLNSLLLNECFLGYESLGRVANGIMGAVPQHWFLKELSEEISSSETFKAIPLHTTNLLLRHGLIDSSNSVKDITIYPKDYFYPYNPYDPNKKTKQLLYSDITKNTIAIHHWAKNWEISFLDKATNKLRRLFK